MEEIVLQKIDEIANEMIDGIKFITKIKSVRTESSLTYPFGKDIDDCLNATLSLARSLGFETENVDHMVGIAKYGKGDDYIGIIGHLDVVETKDGWNHDPFSCYEDENGRIYARGILDNKGPILANLYALYAIKECGIQLKHPVYILFGTNEETGFQDLHHYLKVRKPPIMGWTPDCKYPVVYAERGRAVYQIYCEKQYSNEFNEFVNEYILSSNKYADKLELDIDDLEFGKMQLKNKKCKISDRELCFEFTLSYPASITNEEIKQHILNKCKKPLQVRCIQNYDPVRFDKKGFLCQTLKETYEKVTGLDGTPVTTTGGTYAKCMPNIVPFGPSFPGQKGIGHNPNEWMDRKDLILNAKIYALSILRVGGICD